MLNDVQRVGLAVAATLYVGHCNADTRGRITDNIGVSDSAKICMSIGLTASIEGLEDMELNTNGINGASGSIFTGDSGFDLESNGQVAVVVEGGYLYLGGDETLDESRRVPIRYEIDGVEDRYVTEIDSAHEGQHILQANAMLGPISAQLAGEYSGQVTLVVVPAIGVDGQCGSSQVSYPERSVWGTIAYEDLYPRPGDADYNDFVVNFKITEFYNSSEELESINMKFVPVARGAGYNHSFHLSLDGEIDNTRNAHATTTPVFDNPAEVSATYTNLTNGESHTQYFADDEDVKIFGSTRTAVGGGFVNHSASQAPRQPKWVTEVNVSLSDPEDVSSSLKDGDFNYRPYLHVNNTNQDIDLFQVNPNNGMIDRNGYPFGLVVPDDWAWPEERVSINRAYPLFSEYRSWLSGDSDEISEQAMTWFDFPAAGTDDKTVYVDVSDNF